MISLTLLQKEIDSTFVLSSDYRTRKAREGSGGFFISCPILTKAFIDWIEENHKVRLKNVRQDDENSEYVKAFFEELEA